MMHRPKSEKPRPSAMGIAMTDRIDKENWRTRAVQSKRDKRRTPDGPSAGSLQNICSSAPNLIPASSIPLPKNATIAKYDPTCPIESFLYFTMQ